MIQIDAGGRTVELSKPDKVLFPEAEFTKRDLADYYRRVSDVMLPHLEGRPLVLRRYPDGVTEDGFVQQQAPDLFPNWIERATVEKEGGQITHVVADSPATLVYLAGQGCITLHAWLSRVGHPRRPDRLVFDLDPPGADPEEAFEAVRWAARRVRDLLEELGLAAYLMTTGSRGVHVTSPLAPEEDFDRARALAREAAELLAARHPDRLTAAQRKDKRKGRVFLDYLRNSYGQTAVAPYAVRARPEAPVATPLDWDELSDASPRRYTAKNLFKRLGQKDDPWAGIDEQAVSLDEPQRQLEEMDDA